MKIMNIGKFFFWGLILLVFMNSCTSTGFLMAKAKIVMYASPYPAKSKASQIDVYRTTKPTKDYIEIAEISCGDTNDNWNMEQIMIKAREIGADGLIIVGKGGSEAIGVPIGKNVYAVSSEYGLKAIAIKYK
jgi:hypothetical protein